MSTISLFSTYGLRRRGCWILCLLVSLILPVFVNIASVRAAALTPQQERGKQLYDTGISQSGSPVVAYFGKDLLEVPGESATCVSCHGYDGLGRSESGVIPSNITWSQLMKSYGHIHPDGLEHGPFTDKSLKSYMEDGLYPGGTQGDPSMPVYEMAKQELDDLIEYLKILDSYLDPGINNSFIRIGTLLPTAGPAAEMGDVMQRTIAAYFSDINLQGGIYGRRLVLAAESVRNATEIPRYLRTVLPEQGVFALVNTFTPGFEAELWALLEEQRVPLIAPFSLIPVEDQLLHRYRFTLYAGLREQTLVLARYAAQKLPLKNPRILIVYPQRDGMEEILASAKAIYIAKGWQTISLQTYDSGANIPASVLQGVRRYKPDILLFLGGEDDAESIFRALADDGSQTALFMPGVLAGKSIYKIPATFKGKVWLSFPSLPGDRKEWGITEFQAMAARQQLAVTHPTAQLAAYTSAKILIEGLRRAGRSLSRERMLEALEGFFEFDTGLSPLLTYNKNRRIGAQGAHIVEVDQVKAGTEDFITPRGWISAHSP